VGENAEILVSNQAGYTVTTSLTIATLTHNMRPVISPDYI